MILSVLDQSNACSGRPQSEAIQDSLALARRCEDLGYHRYWVSEHHNSDGIVGTAPEILIAAIAATTSRIRIGSAGVMLPHYSALKVAEQFRVIEAIAPGRIDLGLGRAPGSDRMTSFALNPDAARAHEAFPRQVIDLRNWVSGKPLEPEHPFVGIGAHPTGPTSPSLWMLGSSDYGARLGAQLGLPYAFAYFFTEGHGVEQALSLYRQYFTPSEAQPTPYATVCVWALTAETDEEARYWFRSREHWRVGFEQGRREPLMSPDDIDTSRYSAQERARIKALGQSAFVGTPDKVATQLHTLADALQLDELVVVTWAHDPQARIRSYELLAEAMM
ncbi:MAG: LLM class flavin-dependent oxidoreductase [Gammaproteobacteria bacterium]|nr:LLM class flavin-dependent oxidoreductase [Gammaproteobacteria bacterium]